MARWGWTRVYGGSGFIYLDSTEPETVQWFVEAMKNFPHHRTEDDASGQPYRAEIKNIVDKDVYRVRPWVVKQLLRQGWEPVEGDLGGHFSLKKKFE